MSLYVILQLRKGISVIIIYQRSFMSQWMLLSMIKSLTSPHLIFKGESIIEDKYFLLDLIVHVLEFLENFQENSKSMSNLVSELEIKLLRKSSRRFPRKS